MTAETETVRVNFGRPMPVFPLSQVALLPHAVLPLHVYEPRYRQMIEDVLDGAGQIAMAVVDHNAWPTEPTGAPPLKPAVCVGQIMQHERLVDGRYNVLLQGVCRARIADEVTAPPGQLYRTVRLAPIENGEFDPDELDAERQRLRWLLTDTPLSRLHAAAKVAECLGQADAPTVAVLELIGVTLLTDDRVRYSLLEEGDPTVRAALIEDELEHLRGLLARAERQVDPDAPKGVTWN
ncbi:MAG: hypothetical protein D6693_09490 [Planctomycetota bacterium]|nr:MAG: hypothetical protein D6693_09490 [Planctomycetota bacterium]